MPKGGGRAEELWLPPDTPGDMPLVPYVANWFEAHEQAAIEELQAAGLPSVAGEHLFQAETVSLPQYVELAGYAPESPLGYSAAIVDRVAFLRHAFNSGDKWLIVHAALNAAQVVTLAAIDFRHGSALDVGTKVLADRAEGRKKAAENKAAQAKAGNQAYQEAAEGVWARRPTLKKKRVAELVVQQLGHGKTGTVRRIIRKPKTGIV
jgi:hypothetical protein